MQRGRNGIVPGKEEKKKENQKFECPPRMNAPSHAFVTDSLLYDVLPINTQSPPTQDSVHHPIDCSRRRRIQVHILHCAPLLPTLPYQVAEILERHLALRLHLHRVLTARA